MSIYNQSLELQESDLLDWYPRQKENRQMMEARPLSEIDLHYEKVISLRHQGYMNSLIIIAAIIGFVVLGCYVVSVLGASRV